MSRVRESPLSLCVAICTRGRPVSLARAVRSVTAQRVVGPTQLLIVDDGELSDDVVQTLAAATKEAGATFTYVRKSPAERGLYASRRVAIAATEADIVLFIDDDVELHDGYLERTRTVLAEPGVVGVGGVDVNVQRGSGAWRVFARAFLLRGRGPGSLSPSGYGGSMVDWPAQRVPFESEFLSGCSMAFLRSGLTALPDVPWLRDYSLGEDIYLTRFAAASGRVLVDPELRLTHHQDPASRLPDRARARMLVQNHARLVRGRARLAWAWSTVGLFLRSLVKDGPRVAVGHLQAAARPGTWSS